MDYEINEGTLAIIPSKKMSNRSKVLEDKVEYIINMTPFEIVDFSCKYFGSSYEGRKEGSKSIINVNYKTPIIIENSKNIIFFPTTSPKSSDCCWLSLNHIKKLVAHRYETDIIFNNDVQLTLPVSKRTLEAQIARACRLNFAIKERL